MCLPSNVEAATIQRIATIVGNLLCLNFGLMFGITPSHMQLYQSVETPLNRPIDDDNAAWLSAYLFLFAAIGALVFGLVSDRIGPKSVLLLSGLLQISSWFCIHFAYDIIHIHASRMVAGLAAGAAFAVLPIYIAEISEEPNRPALVASIYVWRTLGILLGFALGAYVPYDYVNIVGICVSFVFTMTFPFIQESPYYYMRKGNVASLEKSLRWYRGIRDIDDRDKIEFVRELNEFKSEMSSQNGALTVQKLADAHMPRVYQLRLLAICLVLLLGAQFSGVYVLLNYANEVLAEFNWQISTDVAVLTMAAAQFLGANIGSCIGEKINRRILLAVTSFICGLSLVSLAIFLTYGHQWQLNPLYAPWLPLGLISLHMLMSYVGLYPLSTAVIGEVLPLKLKTTLTSITTSISWFVAFSLIMFFYPLATEVGLVGCLCIFAGFSIFVGAFAIVFMPETRGKSLEEVQQEMGYETNGNVAKITSVKNGHITNGYF